mmetsp:Transcript_56932/g.101643  ORF Transcript_56932/g.101643 Transcript_56932/m.101643 type:complete len:778 (-) Transcript_56932:139-2472(-)
MASSFIQLPSDSSASESEKEAPELRELRRQLEKQDQLVKEARERAEQKKLAEARKKLEIQELLKNLSSQKAPPSTNPQEESNGDCIPEKRSARNLQASSWAQLREEALTRLEKERKEKEREKPKVENIELDGGEEKFRSTEVWQRARDEMRQAYAQRFGEEKASLDSLDEKYKELQDLQNERRQQIEELELELENLKIRGCELKVEQDALDKINRDEREVVAALHRQRDEARRGKAEVQEALALERAQLEEAELLLKAEKDHFQVLLAAVAQSGSALEQAQHAQLATSTCSPSLVEVQELEKLQAAKPGLSERLAQENETVARLEGALKMVLEKRVGVQHELRCLLEKRVDWSVQEAKEFKDLADLAVHNDNVQPLTPRRYTIFCEVQFEKQYGQLLSAAAAAESVLYAQQMAEWNALLNDFVWGVYHYRTCDHRQVHLFQKEAEARLKIATTEGQRFLLQLQTCLQELAQAVPPPAQSASPTKSGSKVRIMDPSFVSDLETSADEGWMEPDVPKTPAPKWPSAEEIRRCASEGVTQLLKKQQIRIGELNREKEEMRESLLEALAKEKDRARKARDKAKDWKAKYLLLLKDSATGPKPRGSPPKGHGNPGPTQNGSQTQSPRAPASRTPADAPSATQDKQGRVLTVENADFFSASGDSESEGSLVCFPKRQSEYNSASDSANSSLRSPAASVRSAQQSFPSFPNLPLPDLGPGPQDYPSSDPPSDQEGHEPEPRMNIMCNTPCPGRQPGQQIRDNPLYPAYPQASVQKKADSKRRLC